MKYLFLLAGVFFLFFFLSCQKEEKPPVKPQTCEECHHVELDSAHQLPCTACHAGKTPAPTAAKAHQGLLPHPASYPHWERTCGSCHLREVKAFEKTPHFTLAKEINTIRGLFGLAPVSSWKELKEPQKIETLEDLVNDLLRRRCLRCHLFSRGDGYQETSHGLGCAACHLSFSGDSLKSHRFQGPTDRECLHCHYGNRVGWDYYGLFEHDYPYQFRSPLIQGDLPPRPWGIEFHELRPDLHLEKGLSCQGCHSAKELMTSSEKANCLSCHQLSRDQFHLPEVLKKASCDTCHARWSFWDEELYLVLHESPDWDDWSELMVQGSSEVEEAFISYLTSGKTQALMEDKFSHQMRKGLWLLTLKKRRFETVHLGYDSSGRLRIVRPWKIYLSYVDAEEEIIWENVPSKGRLLLPYQAHTIGRADDKRSREILKKIRGQN